MNKFMKEFMKQFNPKTFQRIQEDLEKQMREGGTGRPAVFGFSFGVGPDGKPTMQPFGNVEEREGKTEIKEARDPLVDIVDDQDELIVVAEIPGVRKEDIELSATEHTLAIRAKSDETGRNYEKEVDLPAKINPNIARARYSHGILEVKLQKVGGKREQGASIPID
jgi:HSP20 family protein